MDDRIKSTTAWKMPKLVICRHDTNFKVMVIRHARETTNVPQHGNFMLLNSEETKERSVEGANSTWQTVCGSSQGNFSATDEKIMQWVRMKVIAGCCIPEDCASAFQSHKVLDSKVCAS